MEGGGEGGRDRDLWSCIEGGERVSQTGGGGRRGGMSHRGSVERLGGSKR